MAVNQKAVKSFIAAVGLGVFSLTANFNAAAGEPAPAPKKQLEAANENVAPVMQAQQKIAQEMLDTIKGIDDYFKSENHPAANDPQYDSAKDPFIIQSIEKILNGLQAGADPNYVDPQSGISAFAWGLWIAYEMDRPDIVAAFLKHGADPHQAMPADMPIPQMEKNALNILFGEKYSNKPGQITIADHIMRAVLESSALNRSYEGNLSHSQTAAQIAAMLAAEGVSPADAKQLPDKIEFEDQEKQSKSIEFKLKTYKAVAETDILMAKAMQKTGLLSDEEYEIIADGEKNIADIARNMTEITREFLEKHDAPLIFHPDTVPGGPEPYIVQKGDTPQSLSKRFQPAMGVASEAEALSAFTALNQDVIDENGDFIADITGKQIMIPVETATLVGKMPAPGAIHALVAVADRMKMFTGAADLNEAMGMIIQANKIIPEGKNKNIDNIVKIGAKIQIPTMMGGTIETTITADDVLTYIARSLQGQFYKKDASIAEIKTTIKQMNNIDPANLELKQCDAVSAFDKRMNACEMLYVPFYNDSFSHLQPLAPPAAHDKDRKVHLFIVEREGYHQKQASGSATNTAYAINRGVDFSRFHILNDAIWNTHIGVPSDASKILQILQHPENPLRDRIVFSSSMALGSVGQGGVPRLIADHRRNHKADDHAAYENARLNLETLEKASPILFEAVGNEYPDGERYTGRISTLHSGRTVRVGAYGEYSGMRMISPYSTYGADICGPLDTTMGQQKEGTSFSTPTTAALYRQFSEWYGDVLSFEEIMAAGMMSTDKKILDLYARKAVGKPQPTMARYRTNGAGLPMNERCGSGMINAERWNETLKKMVELKQQYGAKADFLSLKIEFDDAPAVRTLDNGEKEYIYRIPVPEDMTLGKLTFLLPQEKHAHSEIVVKTPSGFSYHLQKSLSDVVSTTAFSYEDVKAGDVIEIRTGQPLAETAGMYLRGHESGNTIQLLRDHLRQTGFLPAPLKEMIGDRITGNDRGVTIKDLTPPLPPLPKRPEKPEAPHSATAPEPAKSKPRGPE